MSKEQIICEDCGYEYRGCHGVDFCPKCDEVETLLEDITEHRSAVESDRQELAERLLEIHELSCRSCHNDADDIRLLLQKVLGDFDFGYTFDAVGTPHAEY